ncbi:hypothetical protein D9611_001604 [Ephemerocybe angulata]|uniref:Protein kinase domain-containing protein n=1 Tax=Ephemerocybe angulata TaxID=980116 RepID=A0A8H5CJZ9_9AGAR|nr:hypothetical protein D9611_001604 [Tulosesus angulatus]
MTSTQFYNHPSATSSSTSVASSLDSETWCLLSGTDSSSSDTVTKPSRRQSRKKRNQCKRPALSQLNTVQERMLQSFCAAPSPSFHSANGVFTVDPPSKPAPAPGQRVSPISPACRRLCWDELENGARSIAADGFPATFGEAARKLFRLLDTEILYTRRSYRQFLLYRGDIAQLLVDVLQWMLDYHPSLEGSQRRKILQALLRLAKRSKLMPTDFFLGAVQIGEVFFQTPNVDVFRGLHHGRDVCLKRYRNHNQASRDDMATRIIKESILLRNHRDPGLLPFIGILQFDGDFEKTYLVSPLFKSGTIVSYLAKHPDVDRRLLLKDIIQATVHFHGNNVVHGDIKGCNVLVGSNGRAVLADLGVSRLRDVELLSWPTASTMDPALGTIPWRSPELMVSHTPVSPTAASDVYALGIFAYEVFTGQSPFSDLGRGLGNEWAAARIYLEVPKGRRPSKPSAGSDAYQRYGLTEEIWGMMERCWAGDPKLRPSAAELLQSPFLRNLVDKRPFAME